MDASELQKRPLSFTWQDGSVESVCPEREDPAWVVNIKRSVLSMLQHTAQFVDVPESHVIEVRFILLGYISLTTIVALTYNLNSINRVT